MSRTHVRSRTPWLAFEEEVRAGLARLAPSERVAVLTTVPEAIRLSAGRSQGDEV